MKLASYYMIALLAVGSSFVPANCRITNSRTHKHKTSTVCGSNDTDTCFSFMPNRDWTTLNSCFAEKFPNGRNQTVTYVKYPDGTGKAFQKITDPTDGQAYADARFIDNEIFPGYESLAAPAEVRWPALIIYAENEEEVKDAISCATEAGYKIAPRGRGHSYRGLSTMDGFVVIDVGAMCHPDEFILKREVTDWILPGQKTIANIKTGAGCTNAVMLGYVYKNFEPKEGALYAIGSCPSVGIVGYSTGGGAGDATPWIGWGVDDVLEIDMILHNGTKVTANKDENSDLFWAVRGGGSGLGVITAMKTAVVQSPEPPKGSERRFLSFYLDFKTPNDKVRKHFLNLVQEFLYNNPDSAKFGGGGGINEDHSSLFGLFLGSASEMLALFGKAGLLDSEFLDPNVTTTYSSNFEKVAECDFPDNMPSAGVRIFEFKSYGEAMLTTLCNRKVEEPSTNLLMILLSKGFNWCTDLNITQDKCFEMEVIPGVTMNLPKCEDPEVISAFGDAAYDPVSFLNRQGPAVAGKDSLGGLLIPKLDVDVLNELAKIGFSVNHLQHGAPMARKVSDTAYPWRDTAILTEFFDAATAHKFTNILANQHYKDGNKLQGYYNYMNPGGNANWRYYYFGEHYDRLTKIKAKYDPLNYFSNPYQVEPAVTSEHSTKGKH